MRLHISQSNDSTCISCIMYFVGLKSTHSHYIPSTAGRLDSTLLRNLTFSLNCLATALRPINQWQYGLFEFFCMNSGANLCQACLIKILVTELQQYQLCMDACTVSESVVKYVCIWWSIFPSDVQTFVVSFEDLRSIRSFKCPCLRNPPIGWISNSFA